MRGNRLVAHRQTQACTSQHYADDLTEDRMDRLVIGGIGGVAAALALARNRIPTIVLEQASELSEIGAGIQIAPNAFHCFDRLGVGDRARSEAVYVDRLRLMDGLSGVHLPLDATFRERFRNPYAVVHRADLQLAMLEAARETRLVEIRTDYKIERYEQDGTSVTVHCAERIDNTRSAFPRNPKKRSPLKFAPWPNRQEYTRVV
jgi:3-hydroxybenzoate 6-monooxygenase